MIYVILPEPDGGKSAYEECRNTVPKLDTFRRTLS